MYISIEDIEKYKEEIRDCFAPLHREVINAFVYGLIQQKPAEVAPVKNGKWEKRVWIIFDSEKVGFNCSECNTTWDSPTKYCPNCGAKNKM